MATVDEIEKWIISIADTVKKGHSGIRIRFNNHFSITCPPTSFKPSKTPQSSASKDTPNASIDSKPTQPILRMITYHTTRCYIAKIITSTPIHIQFDPTSQMRIPNNPLVNRTTILFTAVISLQPIF
ncbi:hypothetical protein ACOSQ4_012885 [Xanthoceras sorbifolium]